MTGMAYFWSADYLPYLLHDEIVSRLQKVQVDPWYTPQPIENMTVTNGADGSTIKVVPSKGGRRVGRRATRKLFSEGINVQVGDCIVLSYRYLLTLGTTATSSRRFRIRPLPQFGFPLRTEEKRLAIFLLEPTELDPQSGVRFWASWQSPECCLCTWSTSMRDTGGPSKPSSYVPIFDTLSITASIRRECSS